VTDFTAPRTSLVARWAGLWFGPVPPHSFALVRITLGCVGLLSLAGLTPVELYWPLDGMVPVSSGVLGFRAVVASAGLGTVVGWAVYVLLVAAFAAMTVGYRSDLAVLACFLGVVVQHQWNRLPLSSAHQVMLNLLFCLIWAETGRVWSVDAMRRSSAAQTATVSEGVAPWPLWLMRFQIAVVYGSSGLWKLANTPWRDGSAVHWVLNLNGFHRFPWAIPAVVEPGLALLTWGTVAFELAFPVLVCFRRTRAAAVLGGIGLHLGLGLTLELGPFSILMIASYAAFLDPERTPALMERWS
jgi:hypothetical protein